VSDLLPFLDDERRSGAFFSYLSDNCWSEVIS